MTGRAFQTVDTMSGVSAFLIKARVWTPKDEGGRLRSVEESTAVKHSANLRLKMLSRWRRSSSTTFVDIVAMSADRG